MSIILSPAPIFTATGCDSVPAVMCILHSLVFFCVLSLCTHDSEPFDVFGLSLFLWDNLSCLLAPRVRKHNTQISPPPCRMQWWANCPNIQDLWGVKHPAGSTAHHSCQIWVEGLEELPTGISCVHFCDAGRI